MSKGFRMLSLALSAVFAVGVLGGCGQNASSPTTTPSTPAQGSETPGGSSEAKAYYELLDEVDDTSDLPDWTGKQLKLKAWYTHGTGDANRPVAENDVVTPEVKRVTGVELDREAAFDNGGMAVDVKMGLLSASNDWPDVAFNVKLSETKFHDLIDAGKIYDLTDLLPQYAPHVAEKFPIDKLSGVKATVTYPKDGRIYAFPYELSTGLMYEFRTDLDTQRFSRIATKQSRLINTKVMVRDDLLKKLFPEARTMDEIEALYMEKGTFTQEDIYDVPIKTQEEFVKFMYDLKDLIAKEKITENGKPVEVTYANSGGDNWNLLNGFLGSFTGIPGNNNYFTVFYKQLGQMDYAFNQDYLKDSMLLFNKFVRDGVMAKDSLLNNNAAFLQVLNSGGYAITYNSPPDEAALKQAGKTYRYRPLWLDQEFQEDKFITPASPQGSAGLAIFKDSVKEEDLPQLLRYLDYMISDVGEKLVFWGPESAGLFEEVNGKRVYKDKDLENNMVYAADNGANMKYNLTNYWVANRNAWPRYPIYAGGSDLHPRYVYDISVNATEAGSLFNPAYLPGGSSIDHQTLLASNTNIYSYTADVPEVDRFWKARESFEKAMTKTLAATSDAQFEQLWKAFLDTAEANGATQATLDEINRVFKEKNAGYLDNIK